MPQITESKTTLKSIVPTQAANWNMQTFEYASATTIWTSQVKKVNRGLGLKERLAFLKQDRQVFSRPISLSATVFIR